MSTDAPSRTDDRLFAPAGEAWRPVSPDFATVELLAAVVGWVPFVAVSVVACAAWAPLWVTALVVAFWVLFWAWRVWANWRIARTWAYALAEHDLLITHGRWFKELVVVPYGRMQVVEVTAGPLLRRWGLATVTLATASASTGARVPGLPSDEAARLREELSRRGDDQAAGL